MAVRSVLTVDVDDSKFKAFAENFKKYQDLLAKTPKAWGDVSAQAGKQAISFDQMAAALLAQTELSAKFTKEQRNATTAVEHQAVAWHHIAASAKSFAGHVLDATRLLLRWGAATTAIGGILGIGGLWGFDRFAQIASSGRRSSLGLGTTFGEQRAFGINYGRVVDPGQFLGGVNDALHNLQARPALYGAGLTEGDIRGKDTAQVAALVLQRIKPLLDRTPESQLGQLLEARHLGQLGLGLQDLERIRALSPNELGDYQKHFGSDAVRLNLTQRELVAWQRLQVQLTRAGDTIESSLIRALTPLAPELAALSKGFTDVVHAFLKSPDVKHWIDLAAGGLETFAKYIATPKFKTDVEWAAHGITLFAKDVIAATKKIDSMLDRLGVIPGDSTTKPGSPPSSGAPGWLRNIWNNMWLDPSSAPADPATEELKKRGIIKPSAYHDPFIPDYNGDNLKGGFSLAPGMNNGVYNLGNGSLPAGLLAAVKRIESGGNPWAVNRRSGAMGAFQFIPSTWAQYGGGGNPFDPADSARAAGRYLSHLMQEFGGSVDKALAAYNWGPGNLEGEIKQFGAAWRQHLPPETQNYLARILPQINAYRPKSDVTVQDRTGGSVVISGAQLAGA